MDAANLMEIVSRRSFKLIIDELAMELFWSCLRYRITTSVEWVPMEENAFGDDISKMLISEDSMLSRKFFGLLVQVSCGHQCIREAMDKRKLMDQLSLSFD